MTLEAFMSRHGLPAEFEHTAVKYYAPLAQWVHQQAAATQGCFYLGINGAQGTGKSTLSNFLAEMLHSQFDANVVELSIDDLYLTRAERAALAASVHPLLKTRGVPGTHDVALGCRVLKALGELTADASLAVPRFDKASDDRCPMPDWPRVIGPVDVVILEGWCVGSTAQAAARLGEPINDLEAGEDAAGMWREYVNASLEDDYPELFGQLDALVVLQAPSFEAVYGWRTEQEHKLRKRAGGAGAEVLSDAEVIRFVQHFERLTRHNFEHLEAAADAVIRLGMDHQATELVFRSAAES